MGLVFRTVLGLFLSLFFLTSWASDATDADKKLQVVYVSKVIIEADMDRDSPDEVKYYADLETEATGNIVKWFKGEGYVIAETPNANNERLLIVKTKALFNAGNKALRWIGGIGGAGKASVDVTMEVIEPQSEKLVLSKNVKDTLRMGGFGGSAPSMLMGAIDSAWNLILVDLKTLNERRGQKVGN